jgi:cytochrome c556
MHAMQRRSLPALAAAAVAACVAALAVADDPAPRDGPGWTGLTNPTDIVSARLGLMIEIEEIMKPIDSLEAGVAADPDDLRVRAHAIEAMLAAVPHLFPPTTNLYDPAAQPPATLALPEIWKSFPTFYAFAGAAREAAEAFAETRDDSQLEAAARTLRGTCDACHAVYLRKYVPPEVSEEDVNFDFDSALEK